MKFIILITFFFSFQAQTSVGDWSELRDEKFVKTWKHKKNTDVYLSRHENKPSTPGEWTQFESKKYRKEYIKQRNTIMEPLGITKWTAKNFKWKKMNNKYRVDYEGSYVDRNGKLVFFKETHFYMNNKTVQFLVVYPEGTKNGGKIGTEFIEKQAEKL